MGVTSQDVARLAGVSQPTVSRALRNDPRVTAETRARVLGAARALDYVPSEMGRSLSTQATRRVAMVADLSNPLYPLLVPAIHDALELQGYRMVLLAEREGDTGGHAPLFDRSVDGVVLTTTRVMSSLPLDLQQRGIMTVLLNRTNQVVDTDSVVADNQAAGRAAIGLLIGAGHDDIGLLAGSEETSTGRDREQGVRDAMAEAGLALPRDRVVQGWFDHDSGDRGLRTLMTSARPPRAVVCVSDAVAIGALNAARALQLRVPADLSVVGIDDLPAAAWPICDLSTIAVPLAEMAREAIDLLVGRMQGTVNGPAVHSIHPVTPIPRGTHARNGAALTA